MHLDQSILSLIVFTPLVGAAVLALLPDRGKLQPAAALVITLLTFLFTLHLPAHWTPAPAGTYNFELNRVWIATPSIHYHVGVDGLSMWLLVLSGLLAPLGILASWNAIASRRKLFYTLFLLLQVAMLGVFVSLDLFLYYAFWELVLVPTAILIAIFGRTENRRRAALKYFLYAFVPSGLLLVGMLWIYNATGTFDVPTLTNLAATHQIPGSVHALWLVSLSFLLAFAVKVPVFPLHGWLSDGIQEAPTAVVMVLAGKLGLYSILRFSFGIFPDQSHRIAPLMIALGAIGIVYGALIAYLQNDMKKLAAYSTLGHLSFIILGIFTFTAMGLDGGMYQILNHGISGGALFILMGLLYERYHTYDMRALGGLAKVLPWVVTMFVITALSNVGLPMLNSFVGEFLILAGSMKTVFSAHNVLWCVVATTGVILSAAYLLTMIQRVFYGSLGALASEVKPVDLNFREHVTLWPLVILFLAMGVGSTYWMRSLHPLAAAYSYSVDAPPAKSTITHVEAESYVPANGGQR